MTTTNSNDRPKAVATDCAPTRKYAPNSTAAAPRSAYSDKNEARREGRRWARALQQYWPPDFDPVADAELTRQRGALARLVRDIPALGDPAEFVNAHADYARQLASIAPGAEAARAWLEAFVAIIERGDR